MKPLLIAALAFFLAFAPADAAESKPGSENLPSTATPSEAPPRSPAVQKVLDAIARGSAVDAYAAARAGHSKADPSCTYLLGQMHEQGRALEKPDAVKALALYEEAAKGGVREAMSAVARCFETGVGTEVNKEKAFFFWQMAAEAGDPPALSRIGLAEADGEGRPANPEAARTWLEKAAQARDPHGLYLLSRFYDLGRGGLTVSVSKAVELCLQAANAGDPDAMQQMGEFYAAGRGFSRDYVAAAGWYRLAADYGHAGAMANLALCYLHGQGARQNERAAMELAAAAARVGQPRAQYVLGRIFEEGLGCPPSPVFGLAYHLRALKGGIIEAGTAVKRLRAKLDPTAITQAENLAGQSSFHLDPARPAAPKPKSPSAEN